jgi:glycosyltransferase involved in cell wall biosynthesis
MHTRFETYFQYYGLGFVVPAIEAILRRFYQRCDLVLPPSPAMEAVMREKRQNDRFAVWARGIETSIFNPARRSLEWRRSLGLADEDVVIGFLGRLVLEKGLDAFSGAIRRLTERGVPNRVMVVGDGPSRDWFASQMPGSVFTGFLSGPDLGRAVASMDVYFNPSMTEAFGNVTLEAMACALPVVAARSAGSEHLVRDGVTGLMAAPDDLAGYADALAAYCTDTPLRLGHGQAGLQASRAYDWDRVNQVVLDAYQSVLAERNARLGSMRG